MSQQIEQFVQYGREVVAGMPASVDDIGLRTYLQSADERHLNVVLYEALRKNLSGTSHGGIDVDPNKWAIDNQAFFRHIPWLIRSGLWTSADIDYPSVVGIDPNPAHNIGLDIPGLSNEQVTLSKGEENADTAVVVGALTDGLIRRSEVANDLSRIDGVLLDRVVILSGPRPLDFEREGSSGRYKQLVSGNPSSIGEVFSTEYDVSKAIAKVLFGGSPTLTIHDHSEYGHLRGGEIARVYNNDEGVEIIVMNGMPVTLVDAVNRPNDKGLPRAPLTFEEYLNVFGVKKVKMSYISSMPHCNRIAIEGVLKLIEMGRADDVTIYPQGLMTFPDKLSAGLHAGEIKPMMDLTRRLVAATGLPRDTIPRVADSVKDYLASKS